MIDKAFSNTYSFTIQWYIRGFIRNFMYLTIQKGISSCVYMISIQTVRRPSPYSDHNYAQNSVTDETQYPCELFGVVALSLLLLFDFFLSTVCQLSDSSLSRKEPLPMK